MRPLDIRTPVKRGLELARSKFRVNGDVAVETELPANLPKILGDEGALAEAVAHLVANAAEAVTEQKKPKITLSAKPIHEGGRANAVLVTVQDNGHGIAPEMREKVFSPFCTTKARGMGLGLPIVKRTVFDHNGRVDIDTSASGTAVSIALPATANGELASAKERRAVRASIFGTRPATIPRFLVSTFALPFSRLCHYVRLNSARPTLY